MFLNRIAELLRSLLGFRRQPAYCPVRKNKTLRCLLVVLSVVAARSADASVLVSGDVSPSDNPFTFNINEGLPSAGNKIDPFADPDPAIAPTVQTLWEGIYDAVNNTNINKNIIVGKTSTGILQISQVELRDMNLVIGDSAAPTNGATGPLQYGIGTVYITGMGSLFNNDPYRLPPGLPANFRSKNQRLTEGSKDGLDGAADGFDLYVGRTGFGTLRIDAFGRAEIEDSVLIGDSTGAIGNLIIDGFNSSLINGGSFDFGPTTSQKVHMTIIGRQGTGNLTISNAATMVTQVFASSGSGGQQGIVGASLGSSPYTLQLSGGGVLPAGGNGTATITGIGSKWSISGSLQVGGFDNGTGGGGVLTTGGDLEGDDVEYGSQAGRGTLNVNEGGLVQVQNAIGVNSGGGQEPSLVLAIGRFGTVNLAGGTIQVGGPEGGQQDDATPDSVAVINDGIITGTGRINTGVFRNRYFGKVRVDLGQSLTIDSSSEFNTSGGGQTPAEPLVNYGTIQVLGNAQQQAQLEFIRSPQESDANSGVRPFVNLPLTDPPATSPAFTGGLISGQFSTMRFGSGLENRSLVSFTAGTNNISGRVVNLQPVATGTGTDPLPTARMLVSGAGTTAVFENDLAFGTGTQLNLADGGKAVVLNEHSLTLAGDLSMNLSYTRPSLITVSGDVGIGQGSSLSLNFASDVLHTLAHGDAFQLISFGGAIGNVNLTDPLSPIPDLAVAPLFSSITVSPNVFNLYGLVAQVQFANEGVYAVFLDPTQVGPAPGGAVGPDFNGDGIIDLDDFAIWQAHVGITSGASVLDGDADGDGDVDGADFLFWQRNVGKPMPWTGSGAGSGLGGGGSDVASVPEPTSFAMLAFCGSLALGCVRRRTR